jgi:hypothetical protein
MFAPLLIARIKRRIINSIGLEPPAIQRERIVGNWCMKPTLNIPGVANAMNVGPLIPRNNYRQRKDELKR